MNNVDKDKDSWEQLGRQYAGRPTTFAVHGIIKMIRQVVEWALPIIILLCFYFCIVYISRLEDSRFRARMEREIQNTAEALEKTELPKEAVEIIGHAVQSAGQDVRFYVHDKFMLLLCPLLVLAAALISEDRRRKRTDATKGKTGDGTN